jgi:hypothetical protein
MYLVRVQKLSSTLPFYLLVTADNPRRLLTTNDDSDDSSLCTRIQMLDGILMSGLELPPFNPASAHEFTMLIGCGLRCHRYIFGGGFSPPRKSSYQGSE